MIRLATFIDRTNSKKTTTGTPRTIMPAKKIDITETDAESDQYGLINNSISGNQVYTTSDFIQLHFQSTMAVVGLAVLIIGLCCVWRLCKAKNVRKIARFICLQRCRVTEEMLETVERPRRARRTTDSDMDLLEMEAVVSMANKTAIENAYLRNMRATPVTEESNPSAC